MDTYDLKPFGLDLNILYNTANINIHPIHDTMLMSFCLDAGKHLGHGMDALAKNHLNIDTISYSDVTGKGKDQLTFDYVSIDKAKEYAAQDADITFRLYKKFYKSLKDEKLINIYEVFEKPMIKILAKLETSGILSLIHI